MIEKLNKIEEQFGNLDKLGEQEKMLILDLIEILSQTFEPGSTEREKCYNIYSYVASCK